MTSTAAEGDDLILADIGTTNGRNSHVAFDNFDRFINSTSGKYTQHDTVGIIYQFVAAQNEDSAVPFDGSREEHRPPSRKRRQINEITQELKSYHSKPKTSIEMLAVDSFASNQLYNNLSA